MLIVYLEVFRCNREMGCQHGTHKVRWCVRRSDGLMKGQVKRRCYHVHCLPGSLQVETRDECNQYGYRVHILHRQTASMNSPEVDRDG